MSGYEYDTDKATTWDATFPGGDSDSPSLHRKIEDDSAKQPDQVLERSELLEQVRDVLGSLTAKEEKIIRLRFGLSESDYNSTDKFKMSHDDMINALGAPGEK